MHSQPRKKKRHTTYLLLANVVGMCSKQYLMLPRVPNAYLLYIVDGMITPIPCLQKPRRLMQLFIVPRQIDVRPG